MLDKEQLRVAYMAGLEYAWQLSDDIRPIPNDGGFEGWYERRVESSPETLEQKVIELCDTIGRMWRDDSTQDDVAEQAEALRAWMDNDD